MTQQQEALAEASVFVRPGGRLLYVTCSVLPEENEAQIARFLAANPAFASEDATATWTRIFGDAAPKPRSGDGTSVTLTPATTGTDGFFFAALTRKA